MSDASDSLIDLNQAAIHSKNLISVETLGLLGTINPFANKNSSSRAQMTTNHLSQKVQPRIPELPRILSGFEDQLSRYTFDEFLPPNSYIIDIIPKYMIARDRFSPKYNPSFCVIFQNTETKEFDSIVVSQYISHDHKIGMVRNIHMENLVKGRRITDEYRLSTSSTVIDNLYTPTINAQTCYMGVPGVIEDGFVISDELASKSAFFTLTTYTVAWNKYQYPVNHYKSDEHYIPIPELGMPIKDDGILIAIRKYDPSFLLSMFNDEALTKVDYINDNKIYAEPGGVVVDLDVLKGNEHAKEFKDIVFLDRYVEQATMYYKRILDNYRKIVSDNPDADISNRFHVLVREAVQRYPSILKGHSELNFRIYRKTPIETYMLNITVANWQKVTNGSKYSDKHGGKGVVCSIWPKEHMPMDQDGNQADLIIFPKSTISRLNPGQLYEQFINACSSRLEKEIAQALSHNSIQSIWDKLMSYYEYLSPDLYNAVITSYTTPEQKHSYLEDIVKNGLYLIIRPDNVDIQPTIIKDLEALGIRPCYGPVTYINDAGEEVTTSKPVLIGDKAMLLLDKSIIGKQATSTPLYQTHGFPTGSSKNKRYNTHISNRPVRFFGVAEVRLLSSIAPEYVTRMLNLSNNARMIHESVINTLNHNTNQPMEQLVQWDQYPIETNAAHRILRTFLNNIGVDIVHKNIEE